MPLIKNMPATLQIAREIGEEKKITPLKVDGLINELVQEKDVLKASDLSTVFATLKNKIKEVKSETKGWFVFFWIVVSSSFRKEVNQKKESVVKMNQVTDDILNMLRSQKYDKTEMAQTEVGYIPPPPPHQTDLPNRRLPTAALGKTTDSEFKAPQPKKIKGVGFGNSEELQAKIEARRKKLEEEQK